MTAMSLPLLSLTLQRSTLDGYDYIPTGSHVTNLHPLTSGSVAEDQTAFIKRRVCLYRLFWGGGDGKAGGERGGGWVGGGVKEGREVTHARKIPACPVSVWRGRESAGKLARRRRVVLFGYCFI